MGRQYIVDGDEIFANGTRLLRKNNSWIVLSFEDDSYFAGHIVEDIENKPYIERE